MKNLSCPMTFYSNCGPVLLERFHNPNLAPEIRDGFVVHVPCKHDEDLYLTLRSAAETLGHVLFDDPAPEPNPALEAFHQASAELYPEPKP